MKRFAGIWFGMMPMVLLFIYVMAGSFDGSENWSRLQLYRIFVFGLLFIIGVVIMSAAYMMQFLIAKVQVAIALFWVMALPAFYAGILSGFLSLPNIILNALYAEMDTAMVVLGAYGFALVNGLLKLRK